jgi:hypothetical protein
MQNSENCMRVYFLKRRARPLAIQLDPDIIAPDDFERASRVTMAMNGRPMTM